MLGVKIGRVRKLLGEAVKAGTVVYNTSDITKEGYLECNGALLSRSAYADLFEAIGTTYGAGDGVTTFAIPDTRGYFIRTLDDGRGIDGGRILGTLQEDDYKSHNHTGTFNNESSSSYNYCKKGYKGEVSMARGWGHGRQTSNVPAQGGGETRPRNIALKAIIKY